jgi:hypothetical protein
MSVFRTLVGTSDAIIQPNTYGKKNDGRYSQVSYESTDPNKILAIAYLAESQGAQYEVKNSFGKSRIDITYNYSVALGTQDPTTEMVERWEMVPLKSEISILESKNPLALSLQADSQSSFDNLRKAVNSGNYDNWIAEDAFGNKRFGPPGVSSVYGLRLGKLLFDGLKTTTVSTPALKRTKIVNDVYLYQATIPTQAMLYSTPAVIADFNVPTSILVQLPVNDTAVITRSFLDPLGNPVYINMGYGWIRSAPEVSQIANLKWQMMDAFEYGLWPLDLFGGRLHDI